MFLGSAAGDEGQFTVFRSSLGIIGKSREREQTRQMACYDKKRVISRRERPCVQCQAALTLIPDLMEHQPVPRSPPDERMQRLTKKYRETAYLRFASVLMRANSRRWLGGIQRCLSASASVRPPKPNMAEKPNLTSRPKELKLHTSTG